MSEPYATGIAPANNNYASCLARADWPIVTEAAAGKPVTVQILRIDFEGPIGNSNSSEVRVSSAERIGTKRLFNRDCKMAISVKILMLKVGYFLQLLRLICKPYDRNASNQRHWQ